jgi:hypothetical protein
MIMRQHDTRTPDPGRVGNDGPDRESNRIDVAIEPIELDATGGRVDMSDPQLLDLWTRSIEAAREESPGGIEAIEHRWRFGTLNSHAMEVTHRACDRPSQA